MSDVFNPNVITEGDGRMEIFPDGERIMVKLVWDGARGREVCFLLGARDAVAIGKELTKAGSALNKQLENTKALALATVYEESGNPMMAGMLRVEAANILDRPDDWKPIHKPSLGPYNEDNPCVCVNCGRPSRDPMSCDYGDGEDQYCDHSLKQQVEALDQ